jgi:excisionase family DNA binding protein
MTDEHYLVLEEVAAKTRASVSTVRQWVRTGKLPSVQVGRRRLVRTSDLEAFMASRNRAGSSQVNAKGSS